jgi:O-antigen ligase
MAPFLGPPKVARSQCARTSKLRWCAVNAVRPRVLELGVFLIVVALPIAFTTATTSPFADLKVVILALGTLFVWAGGLPIDRRLARVAGLWVAVTAIASFTGVDTLRSLTASTTGGGGGLLLTGCCAYLLVAGASMPSGILERARVWFGWTGAAVGLALVAYRVFPGTFSDVSSVSLIGASFGNQLFASAFVAAAVAAVATDRGGLDRRGYALLAVMALGLSAAGERSSFILPLIGMAAGFWRGRVPLRRGIVAFVWVVVLLVGFQIVEPALSSTPSGSTAAGQFGSAATDTGRFVVWGVSRAAWDQRPWLGWGPGNMQSGFLHAASASDLATATRGWNDAHDLFLETAVTAGWLGLASLLWLALIAIARALRAPPELGWAVAAAAALAAYSAVEPLNLALTPLLFLFVGSACSWRIDLATARGDTRSPRAPTGAVLGVAVAAAVAMFAGSALEQYGHTYDETWAYRAALRVQPWRISAQERLALQLALDGRSGDDAAAAEARRTIDDAVRAHPWDPSVRLSAADVETLLKDTVAARTWLEAQLQRFPGDVTEVGRHANAPPGLPTPG